MLNGKENYEIGGIMFKWLSGDKGTNKVQYNSGYNYAAGTLLREERTVEDLTMCFDDSELDPFDQGMLDAINKLEEIGFIKKIKKGNKKK